MSAAAFSFDNMSPVRAAWQSFANTMRWWSWCVVALLVFGVPALGLFKSPDMALGIFIGITPVLAFAVWGLIVANTLHQNHPTLARLLPHQPRRLRLNLIGIFLIVACASKLLEPVVPISNFGVWVTLSLIFVAAAMRQPMLWATTALMGFAPLAPRYMTDSAWQSIVQAFHLLETPLGMLCLLAGGTVFLASLVKDGDEAHRALYQRLQKRRRDFKAAMDGEAANPGTGWWGKTIQRGYQSAFARVMARAEQGRAGFSREMLALGPQAHLSSTAMGILVLFVIMTLVLTSLWLGGVLDYDDAGKGVGNSMFGLLGTLMGGISQLHGTVIKRRHEQSLVALLPGVPRGEAFNRQFGRALMRDFLILWGGGSIVMSVALSLVPGSSPTILAFPVVLLACGLVLLRDWSKASPLKGWLAFLVYMPLGVAAAGARVALEKGWLNFGSFLVLALAILVPLYVWRWRVMMKAPMAWPAARR